MFVEFEVGEKEKENFSVSLKAAYHLQADASYRVEHEPLSQGFCVLLWVREGKGFLRNQKSEYSLKQGDILLFQPEQIPFFYGTEGEIWEFWWFEFLAKNLLLTKERIFSFKQNIFFETQCRNCLDLLKRGRMVLASSMFCGILAEISWQIESVSYIDEKKSLFVKACQLIQRELSTITVKRVAFAIGLGERELRTLFWQYYGQPPKKYIMSAKLDMACFMLKNTNKTIGEISDSIGFSSQFHFSRVFRETMGITPNCWRKNKEI